MAVGRSVAGPIVHRLSPSGVLLAWAIMGGIGFFGGWIAQPLK